MMFTNICINLYRYCGYNNTTVPSDASLIYAASRYGFRGSKGIKQYQTKPYQMPVDTMTEHTPKFLDGSFRIDEWVPPILARTYQTVNGMETPKLWPENTCYPTGIRIKKKPSSIRYNRETTVANIEKVELPMQLNTYVDRCSDLDRTIHDFAKMEACNTYLSAAMTSQLTFETTWNNRVREFASRSLQATLSAPITRHEAYNLKDPTDKIVYSGKTAFIVHSQSADELRYRLRLDVSKTPTPYQNKWNQAIITLSIIKNQLRRDITMTQAISEITHSLHEQSITTGMTTQLQRADFMSFMRQNNFTNILNSQQISLLFNAFDPLKKQCISFIDLIVSWTVLDNPLHSAENKLKKIWGCYEQLGQRSPMDMSLSVLRSCCSSQQEEGAIEKYFRKEFRPHCYSMALRVPNHSSGNHHSSAVSPSPSATSPISLSPAIRSVTSVGRQRNPQMADDTSHQNHRASTASSAFRPTASDFGTLSRSKSQTASPYNISDDFLTGAETFYLVLKRCTILLDLFNEQLCNVTLLCHGRDERISTPKKIEERPVGLNIDVEETMRSRRPSNV